MSDFLFIVIEYFNDTYIKDENAETVHQKQFSFAHFHKVYYLTSIFIITITGYII